MRILLADDTEINRHYLGTSLRAMGHEVLLAVDGQQALDLALRVACDLLVLDLRMPRLFGSDVLVRLRATPGAACQHVPALAISSELDDALRVSLLQDGFLAAIDKPVSAQGLMQAAAGLGIEVVAGGLLGPLDQSARAPDLDDEAATRALGTLEVVQQVRGMLLVELRQRMPVLNHAVAARDIRGVREWIHQLRASCALCGAARLQQTLLALREAVLGCDWVSAEQHHLDVQAAHQALLDRLAPG